MNRFFHYVYILIKPIICLLFPHRAVGLENVPEGGALLCGNHASAWDPIIIAVCLPNDSRLAFMAKEQLFRIPLLRGIIAKLGAFPVKRGGSDLTAMKTAMKRLNEGGRLIIFPEGTRVDHQGEVEAKGGRHCHGGPDRRPHDSYILRRQAQAFPEDYRGLRRALLSRYRRPAAHGRGEPAVCGGDHGPHL